MLIFPAVFLTLFKRDGFYGNAGFHLLHSLDDHTFALRKT